MIDRLYNLDVGGVSHLKILLNKRLSFLVIGSFRVRSFPAIGTKNKLSSCFSFTRVLVHENIIVTRPPSMVLVSSLP